MVLVIAGLTMGTWATALTPQPQRPGQREALPAAHREGCLQEDRDSPWAFVYRVHLSSDGCSLQSLFASSSWKHESGSVWRMRVLFCQTFHPHWGHRASGAKSRVGPRLYPGTGM